ncbi:FliM/FliN family flagellar motor C-terminal domain-containing protein [Steroidobacter sp.]|uniref:FliM/FliN family flagellar motor C-terminal domain-containing protein n=1 Tax=Steroidobacter sp. TaxID=1978227 RepID=UPI001A58208B|nr:FliM/FliN family flagellar motor C-terminal domain-containing protein [Steroidobacter sp.]MBL8265465.1 FliM/FliN family flagellar motor switch protein [Steroidobacter sp.]
MTSKQASVRAYTPIDPRTMGRPVHLLGAFANQLRDDIADFLRTRINRRYKASFQIDAITFAAASADSQRWLSYHANDGRIHFAIERPLLLCLLRYRYGSVMPEPIDGENPAATPTLDEPETATEERLGTMLGQQLVELLVRRIESTQRTPPKTPASIAFTEAALNSANASDGDWLLSVNVAETRWNVSGTVLLKVSSAWMTRLLQALAPKRERSRQKQMTATKPFPARLQLTLRARLLEKEVSLGTLLDLRQGDVLPISVGDADVLIGDSKLFTASIAEHHGKLCLTSLADVD